MDHWNALEIMDCRRKGEHALMMSMLIMTSTKIYKVQYLAAKER